MAFKYAVTLHYFNGKADTHKALAPIEVARSVASLDASNPEQPLLVLPVDVTRAQCNSGADVAAADRPCSAGKYQVASVKALPVHDSEQYTTGDGSAEDGPWQLYSFVGAPEEPAGVQGASAASPSGQVTVTFDRPAADNAAVRAALVAACTSWSASPRCCRCRPFFLSHAKFSPAHLLCILLACRPTRLC